MGDFSRRRFLAAAISAVSVLLLSTNVSAEPVRVIGWLSLGSQKSDGRLVTVLLDALKSHGWIQGKNFRFESRFAGGHPDRTPALAAEIVKLKPDVIFSAANPTALILKKQTTTIPIVMGASMDPVAQGLVPSLARPGGNITGMTIFPNETAIKMVELLAEFISRGSRVTIFADKNTWFVQAKYQEEVIGNARDLGLQVQYVKVYTTQDVVNAYTALNADPPAAILSLPSPIMWHMRDFVVKETAKLKVPSVYPFEAFTDAGGLVAYAASLEESYRRAAWYIDRILRGAKPGDLPIEQPARFRMVVNLKTARAQGITIPPSILLRADRIIE